MAATTSYVCDAYDDDGAFTTSNAVIALREAPPNQPPTATLSATNQTAANGVASVLTCTATDSDGTVVNYRFERQNAGVFVTVQDSASNTFNVVPPNNASTNYRCVVRDDDAAETTSNVIALTRATPPNQAPTATLTASEIAELNGVPVNLTCTAADSDGVITRYVFKRNGSVVLQDSPTDNTYTEVPPNDTTTAYTCEVTDDDGAVTTSNTVNVSRAATPPPPPNQPPTASLSGAPLLAFNGTPIDLVCAAADADGTVANYNFRKNGVSFQTGASNTATNVPNDNATTNYDCVVTDDDGSFTTTNVVSATRQGQPNQPPTSVLSGTNLVGFNGTTTTLTCESEDADGSTVRYVFKRDGIAIQDSASNVCTNMPNNG